MKKMMMTKQKSGRVRDDVGERVVVIAVKASREISRNALIWALTHVVQPGDSAKLLVVIPAHTSSHKLWKSLHGDVRDQKEDITESCSQMMLQLHNIYDSNNIKMKIKVISGTPRGVVAAEAKKTPTQWVVLDKKLKKEAKLCIEDLDCNVVVIKKSGPKVLRLNLLGSSSPPTKQQLQISKSNSFKQHQHQEDTTKVPNVTPVSSPEHSSFTTHHNTSSLSSSDHCFSPYFVADHDWDTNKSDSNSNSNSNSNSDTENVITESIRVKFTKLDHRLQKSNQFANNTRATKTRHVSQSPPLCSLCRNKSPAFGSPPNVV